MELVYRLGWTLMHSLWEGAAVAAIVAIVLTAIPRRTARYRYLCLLLAMLGMLAAFAVTFVVSPVYQPPRRVAIEKPLATIEPDLAPVQMPIADTGSPNIATAVTAPAPQSSRVSLTFSQWMERISPWAVEFWLAGVLLLGIWRSAVWLSIQRLRVAKTKPAEPNVLQAAQRLAHRLNLNKPFDVLLSGFVETPMVIGWLRPVILLPASAMTGLSPEQLEGILAHELAHIRRHDYLANLLQIVAETLLFYHPAMWWMSRQIRLEREQACDDVAVSLCGNRNVYAGSLAALEELRMIGSVALAARGSGGRQMVVRIRRILQSGEDAPRGGLPIVVSILLIATTAAVLFSQSKAASDGKSSPTTKPFSLRNDAPRRSPFTAVRWHGDAAEVQFKNTWYELDSINGKSVAQIMAYLTDSKDFAPRKHFAEDLVEVLRDMGDVPGDTVKLELKSLDTKQTVTITDAPMTEENRRLVLQSGNAEQPAAVPNNPAATAPGADPAARVRQQFDPDRRRLSDLKNRYEIELRQARDDVKVMQRQVVEAGGGSAVGDASPKSMELSRWVQEQIELKTQKLTVDTEFEQLNDKKSRGEIPPPVAQAIERNTERSTDVAHAKEAVESAKTDLVKLSARGSTDKSPEVIAVKESQAASQRELAESQQRIIEQAIKEYEDDLNWRRDSITQRLAKIDQLVGHLKQEMAEINNTTAALVSRKEDADVYRKFVEEYDHSLQEMDQQARTELLKQPQPAATEGAFKYDIPFEQGKTQFLDGDQITITSVKGTGPDMQNGICCITGTYKLASHDKATLAASVTAADAKDGWGNWNASQQTEIQKGSGTFKLLLPISVRGWPHVSFYDGSSFSENYVGTGDWVLK